MARHASAARATIPERARSVPPTGSAVGSARPRLTVLSRPAPRASSVPFAILCSLIIAGTLLAVLMLNISMSDTSYRITRLQAQSQQLTEQQQGLVEENERLGTPQELERRAVELGMAPAADPAYIDLSTGQIIGGSEGSAADAAASPTGAAASQTGADAAGTAADAPSVPAAHIYDDAEHYHGMGNEGN